MVNNFSYVIKKAISSNFTTMLGFGSEFISNTKIGLIFDVKAILVKDHGALGQAYKKLLLFFEKT